MNIVFQPKGAIKKIIKMVPKWIALIPQAIKECNTCNTLDSSITKSNKTIKNICQVWKE